MEIPKCPECNEPLQVVIPHSCGVAYRWDEEVEKYEVDDAQQQETRNGIIPSFSPLVFDITQLL